MTDEQAPPQPQTQSSTTQIVILCGMAFFLFLGVAACQQFLVPIIMDRTGASRTGASTVFSLVYFGGPLWLWLYAYYFRVLREKWSIVLAGCAYTLFGLLIYFTNRIELAIVAALIWGWGGETLWATGPAQIINVSDVRRYGSISGLYQSSVYLGQMLGVIMLGYIMGRVAGDQSDPVATRTGQDTVLLTAVGISLIGNVLSLFLRVKPKERPPARLSDAVICLKRPAGRYLVMLSVANYLGWGLVLTSFTILVAKDLGEGRNLHWIVLPYYVGRLLAAWISGHTSDKVGRERVMLVGFVLGSLSLLAVALYQNHWMVAASSLVLGIQAAIVSVVGAAATGDYIREDERHFVFAGTTAWGYLVAGSTMIASPLLRDIFGNFRPSFVVFAAFYALCAILVTNMRARLRGQKVAATGT